MGTRQLGAPVPLFTSDRERQLWFWAAAVVVAIYSTLGLARTFAGTLRERGLLDVAFVVGLALVVSAVVALGLRSRPGGVEIGVWVGVLAVYLLVLVRMAIPEERTHLIEYGVVAVLVLEALTERASRSRRVRTPALLTLLLTAAVGAVDEGIQGLLPDRVADVRDIGFNALAALMAVVAWTVLRLMARRGRGRRAGRHLPSRRPAHARAAPGRSRGP